MKLPVKLSVPMISLLLLSTPVLADMTVTTRGDTVTVEQTPTQAVTQVVIQPAGSQTVLLQSQPVVVMEQRDPRDLEGRVVKVELNRKRLTIHDLDGRDRRVLLMKQGMINKYRVDDYLQIRLTRDLKEALTVRTIRVPDVEASVVSVDRTNNVIIVRTANGQDRRVMVQPNMIQQYQTGDRVRFYVISQNGDLQEAQIVRI